MRGHLVVTEEELVSWGRRFGGSAQPPLWVALSGELGAGKTTMARAICEGYGVRQMVTSPTFSLLHEYVGASSTVFHLDLFRLGGPDELDSIGWTDLVRAHALMLVEWPERAGSSFPTPHVSIELRHLPHDPTHRILFAGGAP